MSKPKHPGGRPRLPNARRARVQARVTETELGELEQRAVEAYPELPPTKRMTALIRAALGLETE